MRFTICQHIELTADNPPLCYRQPFAVGDARAHEWLVTVTDRGAPVSLAGCAVTCYVRREDDFLAPAGGEPPVTVRFGGSADAGAARGVFVPEAYTLGGPLLAVMRVSNAQGEVVTAAVMRMRSAGYLTDRICDPEGTIPSIDELLGQIAAMEAATRDCQEATRAANAATADARASLQTSQETLENAQAAQEAAGAALEDAGRAIDGANAARDAANAAAGKIDNMTVSASGLGEGQAPTATIGETDGHKHIAFGIPKGDTGETGATPQISVDVATGAAGSDAQVSVTGTAEEPVIHLTIPRGDTGDIGNLRINGKAPDGSGGVTLDAADVGAYPDGSIRTVALSLAVSAWTGSGPYTATIPRGDVTANTWVDVRLTTDSKCKLTADIYWETSAGQITLTTAAKPTGVIEGTMVLMEVAV